MTPKPLLHNQQAVLYSLLYHMVRCGELNLASANKGERKEPNFLGHCCDMTVSALDAISVLNVASNSTKPFVSTLRRLLTNGELQSVYYLGKHFDVERSHLYFPGITSPTEVDGEEEEEDRNEQQAGDLRVEFADPESRGTLLGELKRWTSLDPAFEDKPEGVLAKVKAALSGEA
ncbi:MAG: hypothetical protein E6Q34_08140 [Burkholderiaceae bacterium]|nr:MAG: hypothetical protein E6Q34_08140 [Burkholderiaceae bacterium]